MANALLIFSIFFLFTIACRATECPIECETSHTCCLSYVTGDFRCCPHPNAVCCADGENCCPENTLCDSSSGGCVLQPSHSQEFQERKGLQNLNDNTQPAVEPDQKSDIIFCPDFSYCPEASTCCLQPDMNYGCCPYVSAVCCDDMLHCCPSGENCDETYQYCIGKHQHPSEIKWPAMKLE